MSLALAEAPMPDDPALELRGRTYECALAGPLDPGNAPGSDQGRVAWCATSFGLVPRAVPGDPPPTALPAAVPLPDSAVGVALEGDVLLAAGGNGGLHGFRLGADRALTPLFRHTTPWAVVGVGLRGGRAFVAEGSGGWEVLEITSGGRVQARAYVDTTGYVRQVLALGGELVAVAEGSAGVSLWEVRDASQPRLLERLALGGEVRTLAWNATRGRLAAGVERAGVVLLGLAGDKLERQGPAPVVALADHLHGAVWHGDVLLAAAGSLGLVALDLADPMQPSELARLKTLGSANRVLLVPGPPAGPLEDRAPRAHALVAVDFAGMQGVDVSDPRAPVPLESPAP
jgi:hypothetical protein